MPSKPNARNWTDVQTAIAAVAIVGTLGLWNLFAAPSEKVSVASDEPVIPPTEPPVMETPAIVIPQVKIMFTQAAPQTQTTVVQQTWEQKKKNKRNNDNNNNGGGSVTQTRTS